jgi:hypothetical protein
MQTYRFLSEGAFEEGDKKLKEMGIIGTTNEYFDSFVAKNADEKYLIENHKKIKQLFAKAIHIAKIDLEE